MGEKNTDELEKVLQSTHIKNFDAYYKENIQGLIDGDFTVYMKNIFSEKKLTQQLVFLRADVPERYGYKLLSGKKGQGRETSFCGYVMRLKCLWHKRSVR